jgi:hypothetical protein
MAAKGQTRPVCGYTTPLTICDGTLCLWESPQPGPIGRHSVRAAARSVEVTARMVREAMKDAPLQSQQQGGISLPRVQLFVDMLLRGEEPPAIKVDGKMIVDGNHRYIAARILGMNPKVQLWAGGRPANAVRWEQLPIDFKFW